MIQMPLNEIASAVNGTLVGEDDGVFIDAINTDSRKLSGGELFIALKGDNFDGHTFCRNAIERGAEALLVSDRAAAGEDAGVPLVCVDDTLEAMGRLASYVCGKVSTRLIAITGSNGKTTTKDMVAHLLAGPYQVIKAPASFNNDVGVPLTLFQLTGRENFAVLEMGANHPGEINRLARLCSPEIGVITSIGRAHIEMFGDLRGVATAKAELIHNLPANGTLLLNGDDEWCLRFQKQSPCKTIFFGMGREHELRASDIRHIPGGLSFLYNDSTLFQIKMLGKHNVYNALAAIGIALRCGMEIDDIAARFTSFKVPDMRLNIIRSGSTIILNDSYNANPDSVCAALEALAAYAGDKRQIAVLGDMMELGEQTGDLHAEVGRKAGELGLYALIAIGKHAEVTCKAAERIQNRWAFTEKKDALKKIVELAESPAVFLVKGSRLMEMEKVVDEILNQLKTKN